MQNELLLRVTLAFQKLLQTRQTSRNYQKQVLVMIKHCLGNSQINSIPAWSKVFLHNFSLQNTRKSLRVSASRYYSFTARNERNFRPWKHTLSLTRSIKVHRRALVPYSLPSLWKKSGSEFSNSQSELIPQRDNIHARNHDTCVDIWRQDGAICSKNRKIVPYHRSARIPRLTVSVPDYGSWWYTFWCCYGHMLGSSPFLLKMKYYHL